MRFGGPCWLGVVLLLGAAPVQVRASRPPGREVDRAWAEQVLQPCRDVLATETAADAAFAARFVTPGSPREEATFLEREAAARAIARANARRGALARLTTLLFAFKARVARSGSSGSEPMGRVVETLLANADPCAISGVESVLLAGLFGLPASADLAGRLGEAGPFAVVDDRFLELAGQGLSAAQIFEIMRPADDAVALAAVGHVLREAVGHDGTADTERRLRQTLELVPLVFEPLRIRFYLHARVDAVEGRFGLPLPDLVDQHLFQLAEHDLFRSVEAMRQLRGMPAEDIVARLEPLLDRWFRRTALPGLARAIARDPHTAFAFFVQSGGVVEPGRVSRHSAVVVTAPAFSLDALRHLDLDTALATVAAGRVPGGFVEAFTRVERAAEGMTFAPDDVRLAIERSAHPGPMRSRLRGLLLDGDRSGRVSALDAFREVVLDASKTRGRLDRPAVRAAADLLAGLKARALAPVVAAESGADQDARRAMYLRDATALLLERERRQAIDGAFQQGTSGAAVGFILHTLFMGGSLPVSVPAPGGVEGDEFAEFVDAMTPRNPESGVDYHGRPIERIALVHDGREYRDALVEVIDSTRRYLNISAFDWKTDTGGRDIAYRLMAKKLGIDGAAYARFVAQFAAGLPMNQGDSRRVAFYDIPTTRMKSLLVWQHFMTSRHPDVTAAREALQAAGATLACESIRGCGALDALDIQGRGNDGVRQAFALVEALFAERAPDPAAVRPRRALADYVTDADGLRRFVRRAGLRREDRPDTPLPITIVADGKQSLFNIRWGEPSEVFPYVVTEPIRDVYFALLEFDIRLVMWKAPVEFPWNVGAVPWPGRRVAGRVPMPFVPWPWLAAVPGFGWAGVAPSLGLQWLLASDVRIWWASVNHTKSWSNEAMALESGMGMASKYFNAYDTHKTWHDMGVVVRGRLVDDVNDHFVQVFNQARVNNGGLPASRGTPIPRLRYEDYRRDGSPGSPDDAASGGPSAGNDASAGGSPPAARGSRAWLLTTHPENGDANYRGVFATALAAARHNVYVENSFFSDPLVARLLIRKAEEFRARVTCDGLDVHSCAARRRDAVHIYLILPDSSDKPIVDAVGAADFYEMLSLGIKVHRWNPRTGWSATRMLHSKVWLVDYVPGRGGLAYVGAANATQRSHMTDNEAGILSNDLAFARDVHDRIFVRDLTAGSRRETGENFRVVRASNAVVAGSRWLRRILVELLWII